MSWTAYIALGVADVALLCGLVISTLYLRRKPNRLRREMIPTYQRVHDVPHV